MFAPSVKHFTILIKCLCFSILSLRLDSRFDKLHVQILLLQKSPPTGSGSVTLLKIQISFKMIPEKDQIYSLLVVYEFLKLFLKKVLIFA
jgi:hypothetical protein